MGGCAMIGQSMINVKSGGRTRIAGIASALFLLIFILYASSLIELIPIATLVGVMFMVVIGTFAWNSLKILFFVPKSDALVIILVTGVNCCNCFRRFSCCCDCWSNSICISICLEICIKN